MFSFAALGNSFNGIICSIGSATRNIRTTSASFENGNNDNTHSNFVFTLALVPAIVFTLNVVGMLRRCNTLSTTHGLLAPLLHPLVNVPNGSNLTLVTSLRDASTNTTVAHRLRSRNRLAGQRASVFAVFRFSTNTTVIGFFSSKTILFALAATSNRPTIASSVNLTITVVFVFGFINTGVFHVCLGVARNGSGGSAGPAAMDARGTW